MLIRRVQDLSSGMVVKLKVPGSSRCQKFTVDSVHRYVGDQNRLEVRLIDSNNKRTGWNMYANDMLETVL